MEGEAAKWKLTRPILIKYSPIVLPAAPGERAEDAVRREVIEEVNLVISECTPWETSYCNEYVYGGITYFTNDIIYTCEVSDWDALSVNEPDEAEPVLLKLREIAIDSIGFISIREAVEDLLKQKLKIV